MTKNVNWSSIKTSVLLSVTFFRKSCLYEIMSKIILKPDRPHNMAYARCVLDNYAKDTHSEYKLLIAFPPQQLLHESASMLHHTYVACLVIGLTSVTKLH